MNYGLHTSEELASYKGIVIQREEQKELRATVEIKRWEDDYAAKCFLVAQDPTINEFYIRLNESNKTRIVEGYRRYTIYKKVNN